MINQRGLKLKEAFFQRQHPDTIARDLLGKVLVTYRNNVLTSGIIVETEAYSFKEKGSHAYNNLYTARTSIMFECGGVAYVYLCYGIHSMFNIVTNTKDKADAVLVRALQPLDGQTEMRRRANSDSIHRITSGPGKLAKALGIDRTLNGKHLGGDEVWVEDIGTKIAKYQVATTSRIGIDYAGDDAHLPWRFYLQDNPWVSRR